jgi:hypothetical protein
MFVIIDIIQVYAILIQFYVKLMFLILRIIFYLKFVGLGVENADFGLIFIKK